jgi:hypothetical protein
MVAWHEVPGKAVMRDPSRRVRCDRFFAASFIIWRTRRRIANCGRQSPHTVPYRWSEVIHRSGAKAPKRALERERPQIVNNFAQGASATTNNRPIR